MSSQKLISALCITYGRPHLLEEAIESFLRQDYPNKEMIIVNDLDEQELIYEHSQVKVYNFKERFSTIGEKRNKSVELSSGDVLVTWDDDDISLPWRLSNIMNEFNSNDSLKYFVEAGAWFLNGENYSLPSGVGFFCAYSKEAFLFVGKYNTIGCGEDSDFDKRIRSYSGNDIKILKLDNDKYSCIYRWGTGSYHLSGFGFDKSAEPTGMQKVEKRVKSGSIEKSVTLKPCWNRDYLNKTRDVLVISQKE